MTSSTTAGIIPSSSGRERKFVDQRTEAFFRHNWGRSNGTDEQLGGRDSVPVVRPDRCGDIDLAKVQGLAQRKPVIGDAMIGPGVRKADGRENFVRSEIVRRQSISGIKGRDLNLPL